MNTPCSPAPGGFPWRIYRWPPIFPLAGAPALANSWEDFPFNANPKQRSRPQREVYRLNSRGIAVNSLHPGAVRGTGLNRHLTLPLKVVLSAARWFMKSAARGAATAALLAANPGVRGISGEFWTKCRIAKGSPLLDDISLAKRLWEVSQDIVTRYGPSPMKSLQAAA